MAGISLSGLGSGLDTNSIISQLMQIEGRPQALLKTRKADLQSELDAWGAIATQLTKLRDASTPLATATGWGALATTTSDATVATVTAGETAGATGGSLSFTVDRLARAGTLVSTGAITSTSQHIYDGNLLLAKGADRLGFASFEAPELATGSYTVTVTQASAAASLTGSSLGATVTIDASNDTLAYTVTGDTRSTTLAHGTYTIAELTEALTAALGEDITVSASGGVLTLATVAHGSDTSLALTGGTALGTLGLSVGSATGVDGLVSIGESTTTVSDVRAGAVVELDTANGPITTTLAGPLGLGSVTVKSIATGTGSVADVVAAINRSSTSITATAVKVGTGSYRLQIASASAGAGSNPNLAATTFTGITLGTLTRGQDAAVTIGEGDAAYTVTSTSNTFSELMDGVSITVTKASATPVTVTANLDAEKIAGRLDGLVSAFNATIDLIKAKTAAGSGGKGGGALAADATARGLVTQLYQAFTAASGSGTAALGVTLGRDGRLSLDKAKFTTRYQEDPTAVAEVFQKLTSASDSRLAVSTVGSATQAGTYQVVIDQAATRATRTGAVLGGTLAADETITVTLGTATASYTAAAGASLSAIAAGLNAALSGQGVGVTASVTSGALSLATNRYGSQVSFTVSSTAAGAGTLGLVDTAGATETETGTDVAGHFVVGATAVAATGEGQSLVANTGTALAGTRIRVLATPDDISGSTLLGTVTYHSGLADALGNLITRATQSSTGTVSLVQAGRRSAITDTERQIDAWTTRLALRQKTLADQFQRMESALNGAKSTQSWLTNQISGFNA